MPAPAQAAEQVVRCCRRLWQAGLIAGQDGNISIRLGPDRLLVTPRRLLKADLVPADLVQVDLAGLRIGGFREATSELDLHLRIYRFRPDAGAVIHAHPPSATGLALAGEGLPGDLLPEITLLFGGVPVVPYARPGSPELAEAVEPYLVGRAGLLLANHGAITWGKDLLDAQIRMESMEHAARILLAARQAGRLRRLTDGQVQELTGPGENSGHDQGDR